MSLLSTALIACGTDAPAPSEVRSRIASDLGHVLTEAKTASDASTANLPSGSMLGVATGALSTSPAATRLLAPLTERVASKDRQSFDEEEGDGFDPDAAVQYLNEKVFTDANHVGDGIYKVPGSLACEQQTWDETTNTTVTTIDPECVQQFEKAQLRIRVVDDEGLRFWIQLGANHDEPLGFLLRHDELAVTVDLDDATDATIALAQAFGEQAPNADLSGRVTASLKILGDSHAKFALAFDRAIAIKVAEQGVNLDSAGAFRFTSAAAQVVSVELDGKAPKAALDLGLGATTLHLPGDEFDPQTTDVDLGGLTVNASYQANTATLQNISIGNKAFTVSVDGQEATRVELNPANGRKLDATITADPVTGTETVSVSPLLDLHATVNHAVLGDEPPVYDVTRVQLTGSLRGDAAGQKIEVLANSSFSMTTNPAQYGFAATAGQCVFATEVYDDTTYQSYTTYSVGACQ